MGEHAYTADQLEAGVHNALKARDMEAVVDILTVLVSVDFERGAKLFDELEFAMGFARRLNGESP